MSHDTAPGCLTVILQWLGLDRISLARPPEQRLAYPPARGRPRSPASPPPAPKLPYRAVSGLLSPAEVSLYHVLRSIVGDQVAICPKVGLGDVFFVKTGDYGRNTSYRNRVDRKHIDFLFCDPHTLAPLGGVELDDASHRRADRVERDAFVDRVFAAAGLPIVRVPAQRSYSLNGLRDQLHAAGLFAADATAPAALPPTPAPAGVAAPSSDPPYCSNCGTPMVIRTARRGAHAGEDFWACPNYPQCRTVMPITSTVAESPG